VPSALYSDTPYQVWLTNIWAVVFLLWGLSEKTTISSDFRTFAFIGILGSFTTFSTYGLETFSLFRDGEIKLALANVLITNVLGIALVLTGFIASKYLMIFISRRL